MAEPGRPKINVDDYFAKIVSYLQLGYTLHKACVYSLTPYRQLHEYYEEKDKNGVYVNQDFRNKVEAAQGRVSVKARRNLAEIIENQEIKDDKGNIIRPKFSPQMVAQISQEWLESMEKEDFSKLTEIKDVSEKDQGVELLKIVVDKIRADVKRNKNSGKTI